MAVGRTHGKFDFVDAHIEELSEPVLLFADLLADGLEFNLLVVDPVEDIDVVFKYYRGVFEGLVGSYPSVSPDFKGKLVEIGHLADARGVNGILDELNGAEKRIYRDNPDRLVFVLVLVGGPPTAAAGNFDLGYEPALGIERADDLFGIDDLDVGIRLYIGGRHSPLLVDVDHQALVFTQRALDLDFLQVQDDVGDVLDNPVDALEFVVHPVDANRTNRRALDGAEQHAAERVADRCGRSPSQRLAIYFA